MFSMSISETIEICDGDGDKAFRAWKKRHGSAVGKFSITPAGRGWRVSVFVAQPTAKLTPAAAEYVTLRKLYTGDATVAREAEKSRLRENNYVL